jgi:hypothetical protein
VLAGQLDHLGRHGKTEDTCTNMLLEGFIDLSSIIPSEYSTREWSHVWQNSHVSMNCSFTFLWFSGGSSNAAGWLSYTNKQ